MPESSAPPRVAVIVLNYNGREITLQALASVASLNYPSFATIVVDNGSSDGSFAAVAAAYPNLTQVRTEHNLGVAGGYNLGITAALEGGYDYLLILNNDVEVHPELLAELVRVAERDPRIGCVGPKIYYFWDRARLWSAGGRIVFREAVTKERGLGDLDRGQYDTDQELDYVNGCGMLIRREAVLAAGLWDPIYHLAAEDADWCMRIRRRGFRVFYAPRAVLYHMVATSTGVYTARRTFDAGRSTAIFVRRYANPWQWLTFLAFLAAALPLAYLREWRKGNQGAVVAKFRGVMDGLRVPLTAPPEARLSGPGSPPT